MNHSPDPSSVGETVFAFDKRVRAVVLPYRHSAPAKAIDWMSKVGDQAQMRVVAGGVIAVGLLRRDPRMIGAGIRMLAAHEVATVAKDWVKGRVVRTRPRNPVPGDAHKPHEGHDTRKEKSSFPSGHATGAAASATAFAAVYPQHALAAEAAAAAVAAGRIPGCKHYPSDVAAGAAIGIGSAVLVGALWRAAAWLVAGRTAGR
ncbi:phosphatase PAP2 family protein [Altererythrobacter sp. TH136]|uniref:phosphatase PAP2 family protein n=1 Tax=Altererythrobacter sp. TH136 TaxID=2067415 RepID=UPI0011627A11|nr:phosphatase PAP2 family protein [Altererythrobacter sp. TH136]QDM41235.1 phosphatase PAP2 family protein [Altererythrobacter sp. TH136]